MNALWDKQRKEVLTRLWLAGETARMIAEKLGRSVTRNAVIGKAHRLGLTGKHGSKSAALSGLGHSARKGESAMPTGGQRPLHTKNPAHS